MSKSIDEQAVELVKEAGTVTKTSRLEYSAPRLVEYGSLTSATQFGGSGSSDFLGMQTGSGMN